MLKYDKNINIYAHISSIGTAGFGPSHLKSSKIYQGKTLYQYES